MMARYFGSAITLDLINYKKSAFCLATTMANEDNTPMDPPPGKELDLGSGHSSESPRKTLRCTPRRRRPNAPRGRLQPINLRVVWDTNILVNF